MNGEQIVIQTDGLSKRYNGVNALQGLNLQVAEHSIFGFLGPNGAGKSTTIKLLLGLTDGQTVVTEFGAGITLAVLLVAFICWRRRDSSPVAPLPMNGSSNFGGPSGTATRISRRASRTFSLFPFFTGHLLCGGLFS